MKAPMIVQRTVARCTTTTPPGYIVGVARKTRYAAAAMLRPNSFLTPLPDRSRGFIPGYLAIKPLTTVFEVPR